MVTVTVSRDKTFQDCRRLHHYKYNLGYRSRERNEDLDFGSAGHRLLEDLWSGAPLSPYVLDVDELTRSRLRVLLSGYQCRWEQRNDVLGVEVKFDFPLKCPGPKSKEIRLAGKIDALCGTPEETWIVEHKFTSSDITPGAPYWNKLRMDPQVSMYFMGARSLGYNPVGCIYDVIHRPDTKPYQATPEDKRKYTKDGRLYANQRDRDETLDEYESRLAALIAESPDAWYQRAHVVRLDSELAEFERDLRDLALDIKGAKRHPRNPDACFRYGRQCEFYEVCSGAARLDDDTKFEKLDDVHPELRSEKNG